VLNSASSPAIACPVICAMASLAIARARMAGRSGRSRRSLNVSFSVFAYALELCDTLPDKMSLVTLEPTAVYAVKPPPDCEMSKSKFG